MPVISIWHDFLYNDVFDFLGKIFFFYYKIEWSEVIGKYHDFVIIPSAMLVEKNEKKKK